MDVEGKQGGSMTHRDIVVVGASAGGVQALQTLIAGLPATFPAAVLIVLHIPAHTPSQLHTILARAGALTITSAEDGDAIVPGRVYVAPTDRHLLVEGERIRVTRGPKENRVRPAVDVLFRSAAYAYGPRVIGIVLSGMLDDGTAGLWAIKDRGGIALVQSPEDAQHASMPESAIKYVAVDATLPVAAMPAHLAQLTRAHPPMEQAAPPQALAIETRIALEGNALQGGVMQLGAVSANTCPECHGVLIRIQEGSIVRYRCHTGHAFSLQTLIADVNEEIDTTLWAALRAIEERILLLREMEELARANDDMAIAQQCAQQVEATEQSVHRIRELVLSHSLFGHAAISGDRL
jgi:two-component system, chemotaxis family, protein-glutamate methylesterase/glutaminase